MFCNRIELFLQWVQIECIEWKWKRNGSFCCCFWGCSHFHRLLNLHTAYLCTYSTSTIHMAHKIHNLFASSMCRKEDPLYLTHFITVESNLVRPHYIISTILHYTNVGYFIVIASFWYLFVQFVSVCYDVDQTLSNTHVYGAHRHTHIHTPPRELFLF